MGQPIIEICAEQDVQADLREQLIELIPQMRRFACGLSGSRDRGDELVQAACERLLMHQSRLRSDTRLDSWLYRVIRNLHLDSVRSQAVRDRGRQQLQQSEELQAVARDAMDDQLLIREVQRAMQQLSEAHRAVLMLICVEGRSYREAADILQVPMGTVTSRLIRARRSLIARLDRQSTGSDSETSK